MTKVLNPFDPSTWGDDEKLYFNQIDLALEESLNLPLSNGKPAHAVYLIDKLLRNATKNIRLYSGNLRQVWDDIDVYRHEVILDAVSVLLKRGADLFITLEEDIDGGSVMEHPLVRSAFKWNDEGPHEGALGYSTSRSVVNCLSRRA